LGQSFPNFEIIIVDGLSSDRTVEVAKQNNDSRITVFSEKDRGIYDAMNKGIDLALGDWLLFLGSDDQLFDPLVLEDAHGHLIKTKAEFVYGNIQSIGESTLTTEGGIYDGEFSLDKLLSNNICHQSIFYSKKLFSKIGYYDIRYSVRADWDLNLRCFARSTVQYYDRVLALFSGGGTSSRRTDDFTREERCLKVKEYFGYSFFNRHFESLRGVFLSKALALYTQKKPVVAFRYLVFYIYHTNKTRALKKLAAKLLKRWIEIVA
jgi:glycosyltransferase involved in cell wall biosynthesis